MFIRVLWRNKGQKTTPPLKIEGQGSWIGEAYFLLSEIRSEVIEDIERALPYLDDSDMEELSHRTIGKLQNMTDEEFEQFEMIEAE